MPLMHGLGALLLSLVATMDGYGSGNGRDGDRTVTSLSVVNVYIPLAEAASAGTSTLKVADAASVRAGQLVLVHQAQSPRSGQLGTPSVDLSADSVGRFELARVQSTTPGALTLESPLTNSYVVPGAQLVTVPEYNQLTITDGGIVSALPWDGSRGGVVAFLVKSSLTCDGRVSAAGLGYRGGVARNSELLLPDGGVAALDGGLVPSPRSGPPYDAECGEGVTLPSGVTGPLNHENGGGGASGISSLRNGGAGGGHRGRGGRGSAFSGPPAEGGAALFYVPGERLIFGGGGGAGASDIDSPTGGARGGGAVLVRAATVLGACEFSAKGTTPADATGDGAGGGGAGGTVSVSSEGSLGCARANASGGTGGSTSYGHGPGGGGGGGLVMLRGAPIQCPYFVQTGVGGSDLSSGGTTRGAEPTSPDALEGAGFAQLIDPTFGPQPDFTVERPAPEEIIVSDAPCFHGTASSGVRVFVSVDGFSLPDATASSAGQWRTCLQPESPLENGRHAFAAFAESAPGLRSPVQNISFFSRRPAPTHVGCGCASSDSELAALGALWALLASLFRFRRKQRMKPTQRNILSPSENRV
ncbi:MAG: hypothetical protein ACOZIN_04930 [Myxococcota bacterium]